MEKAITKISALMDELHERTDINHKEGGAYLVLAADPVKDDDDTEGDARFISALKGNGMEILCMLTFAFVKDPQLADIAKHALFMAATMPKPDTDKSKKDTDKKEEAREGV